MVNVALFAICVTTTAWSVVRGAAWYWIVVHVVCDVACLIMAIKALRRA